MPTSSGWARPPALRRQSQPHIPGFVTLDGGGAGGSGGVCGCGSGGSLGPLDLLLDRGCL